MTGHCVFQSKPILSRSWNKLSFALAILRRSSVGPAKIGGVKRPVWPEQPLPTQRSQIELETLFDCRKPAASPDPSPPIYRNPVANLFISIRSADTAWGTMAPDEFCPAGEAAGGLGPTCAEGPGRVETRHQVALCRCLGVACSQCGEPSLGGLFHETIHQSCSDSSIPHSAPC